MADLQASDISEVLAEIRAYVDRGEHAHWGEKLAPIAGSVHDQEIPDGVHNPYWEIIRALPSVHLSWGGDGVTPYGYNPGLGIHRRELCTTYSWAIPTPGDITWMAGVLDGRGVVEVGAGAGYWAWQLIQAAVDVVAYEPRDADENEFVSAGLYAPLLRGDASAAAAHPDRALLLCWPTYNDPWASKALAAYQGDLLLYVGEMHGGCCADDAFFEALDAEWSEVGRSPHHVTWDGIHCRLVAFQRQAGETR